MTSIGISSETVLTAAGPAMAAARSSSPLPGISAVPVANGVSNREEPSTVVDTVAIKGKVRKKESLPAREADGNKRTNTSRTMDSILLGYNNKGDLRIRFMDSKNQLVYQTPPELFSRISDIMSAPRTSVDKVI